MIFGIFDILHSNLNFCWRTNTKYCCCVRVRHLIWCCAAAAFVEHDTLPTCGDRQAFKMLLKSPGTKEISIRLSTASVFGWRSAADRRTHTCSAGVAFVLVRFASSARSLWAVGKLDVRRALRSGGIGAQPVEFSTLLPWNEETTTTTATSSLHIIISLLSYLVSCYCRRRRSSRPARLGKGYFTFSTTVW